MHPSLQAVASLPREDKREVERIGNRGGRRERERDGEGGRWGGEDRREVERIGGRWRG